MARNRRRTETKRIGRSSRRKSHSAREIRHRVGASRNSKRPGRVKSTPELEEALRHLRAGASQKRAGKLAGVSVKRFRRFLRGNRLANYRDGRWRFTDRRSRTVRAITTRGEKEVNVAGFERASLVMQHRVAVRQFLDTNDPSHLTPFEGRIVTDKSGRKHRLETRPNVLYRRIAAGGEPFEQVYQLKS